MKTIFRHFIFFFSLLLLASSTPLKGQSGVRAFGIQFKPIFPLGLVNTDGQTVKDDVNNTQLVINEKGGYSIGAVIRFGFTKRWSFETGINYVRRNYDFTLTSPDFQDSQASIKFIGYEIPAIAMIFVRLGEQMYMNAAGGVTFDLFPTGGVATYDRDSIEYGILESKWIIPAISTNLGFEYRTKNSGYFYIGSSYHLPINDMASVFVSYRESGTNTFNALVEPAPILRGSYLTLDLRYFFNPEMKEKRDKHR